MHRAFRVVVGLFVLLPLLVLVLLWGGGGAPTPRAGAAGPDSSFTQPYNISYVADPNTDASQKAKVRLGPDGNLHVTWMDGLLNKATGPAYSKGQGTSWPAWEWVGPHNNGGYTNPAIAVDGQSTAHVVWAGGGGSPYDIYYAYKPVGGGWSAPENLSNEGYNTVKPSISVDGQGRLWVAWQASLSDTDEEIFVRSKPAGGGWEPVMRITNRPSSDQDPSLAVDSSGVPHLVWRSTDPGNWEIIYTRYVGGNWTAFENISASSPGSHFPRLAADTNGNVYVDWEEETGGDQFRTAVRRWNSGVWGARSFASAAGEKALYPSISADNAGTVYVVWTDYRSSPTEVYFNHSTDFGATWLGDENVSRNGTSSFFPDVAAQAGGVAHIFWQDNAPGQLDIFYSQANVGSVPTPGPTTPIPTVPTNTPTPAAPYGWLDIRALQPPNNDGYTRAGAVRLDLWATSPAGHALQMRYDNYLDFHGNPSYVPYATAVPSWSLLNTPNSCGTKTVYAQFRDSVDSTESSVYSDHIFYDDYLTASLALNGGLPYTNRIMVMVNSSDRDLAAGCSGLYAMRFSEDNITYTQWISYFPQLYHVLAPSGPSLRTLYGQYADRAGNEGTYSDQITLDTNPPFNGSPPSLPASTEQLVVNVWNLQASDSESGMANVWLANRPDGPWMVLPYCASPPCSYSWNLGYGGPPILYPGQHHVYVKYEDRSGYGSFPGNFSAVYSGTITVNNVATAFLPLVMSRSQGISAVPSPAVPADAGLLLLAEPLQGSAGQEMLLYLAVRREAETPLEGTLRLELPAGLQVLRAWSAYGTLLQAGSGVVASRERASAHQAAWILVQVRFVEGPGRALQVQGSLTWDEGTLAASPLWVEKH